MDNTQHTYFAELKLALQKAGYTVQPVEDGHLPIEWNDRRLCQVTESGGIRFRTDDTTDPAAEVARGQGTDIAGVVREYMTLIEQAPDLKANGLGENYKLLAEFNGAVLAGHSSRYGVEFVTWEWNCGQTGLFVGTEHYGGPGDFDLRGGVIESVDEKDKTCSVRGTFFTMEKVPLHYVLGRYNPAVGEEHYGVRGIVPFFCEDKELAGYYLNEVRTMWDVEMGEEQDLSM